MKKLNARGMAHDVVLVAFVAIFAIGGVGLLVASHADSCNKPVSADVSGAVSAAVSTTASGAVSDPACAVSGPASGAVSAPASAPAFVPGGSITTKPVAAATPPSTTAAGPAAPKATTTTAAPKTTTVTPAPVAVKPPVVKLTAFCSLSGIPTAPKFGQILHPVLTIINTGNQAFTGHAQSSFSLFNSKGQASTRSQIQALPTLQPSQAYRTFLSSYFVPHGSSKATRAAYTITSTGKPSFSCSAGFSLPSASIRSRLTNLF